MLCRLLKRLTGARSAIQVPSLLSARTVVGIPINCLENSRAIDQESYTISCFCGPRRISDDEPCDGNKMVCPVNCSVQVLYFVLTLGLSFFLSFPN
jgi:hypothetical protein